MSDRLCGVQALDWNWRQSQEELGVARIGAAEPREPQVGQGWVDPRTNSLCVWDGTEWVCMPAD